MPLVTAAVLAYAAGLLVGFAGAVGWTAMAAAVIVWTGARGGRQRLALATIVVGGAAIGFTDSESRAACLHRLASAQSIVVRLEQDASAGAFVRATHACGARVQLAIAGGAAPAGAQVRVRGAAVQARDGLFVTDATLERLRGPPHLWRWRAAIGRGIDAHFGEHAPLVRALLIADRADFAPAMRDRFAASGLSHMLSVSGLHVGLIAAAVMLVTQLLGVAKPRAQAIIVALTAAYVLLIGMPLPALRAAAMLGVVAFSQTFQRPTSPWAVLAVGGGAALLQPGAVTDLGYQLSIVGMAALAGAAEVNRRWRFIASREGWQGTIARALVVSTVASLLTAPLVAATFGQVSLVAPLSNLAATPVIALLQPMLFLAALLLPVPALAQFVADASLPLIVALDRIAEHAATLPGATLPVRADATSIALATAAAAALLLAMISRYPPRFLLVTAGALAIIAWRPLLPTASGVTEIHMLDVGQGDAIAVRTARGSWILFDAGRDWRGGDEGRRNVVPYLTRRGGRLTAFVLSHPHADHVGGAASTIAALRPTWYFDPAFAGASESYRQSLVAARDAGARWTRVRPMDSLVVDEVTVTFLAPDSTWAASLDDPNDASVVARVRIGEISVLFTGDAEAAEEEWLLANHAELLRADVLKVAHHGSATSSTDAFLDAVQPRIALVSVGAGNMYRHPSPEVMRALALRGAVTLRTDRLGRVQLRTDGRAIDVVTSDASWSVKP